MNTQGPHFVRYNNKNVLKTCILIYSRKQVVSNKEGMTVDDRQVQRLQRKQLGVI